MAARVLIVGQGLAGTALGLALEEGGVDFVIASAGHDDAASRIAAGLINPVTGQRWVKSAQIDLLLPMAESAYRRWEMRLGVKLWHPLAMTRLFRDAEERSRIERKIAEGDLAPFVGAQTERGVEITGAAWVDLPGMLGAAERIWNAGGKLRHARIEAADLEGDGSGVMWQGERFSAAVLCTGADRLARGMFAHLPFVPAKGELISVQGEGIPAGRVVNRGRWILGDEMGCGRVGATYERGSDDTEITGAARDELLRDAQEITGGTLRVVGQTAGVRLTLPDRAPVAGWRNSDERIGVLGGLGSKGALWAPMLSKSWSDKLARTGQRFPAMIDVERFRI